MDLAAQLFNTMTALSLKQASQLRPLSQGEKSLLEQTEAKVGPMLAQAEGYVEQVKREGLLE